MTKIAQTPTPYGEVNVLLFRLLQEVQAALGDQFLGMYLYGSLASGDFDAHSSDIDFVVVTQNEIGEDVIPKLKAAHEGIAKSGLKWASKLEGSYISRAALRRYHPDDPPRVQYNEGQFYLDKHGSDWIIQRHILREHNVIVAGPPLKPWIDPVTPDELRGAVAGVLNGWWASHILTHPQELKRPGYQPFAVLTMCRSLYAFANGEIVSKPSAARWAIKTLDAAWRPLIERALTQQADLSNEGLDKTMALIRYTLEKAQAWENSSKG